MDMMTKQETDLDETYGVDHIQCLLASKDKFYVLANKKEARLGYYLLEFDMADPSQHHYLINWTNKLDIADSYMSLMHEHEDGELRENIVVSYKSVGINTFNVFVFDLRTQLIKYNFEGYQLWESPLRGFLLSSNDFMLLNKDGINLLALGDKPGRVVVDQDGFDRYIHSLGSMAYLRVEPTNHLQFSCQFYDNRQIRVQE